MAIVAVWSKARGKVRCALHASCPLWPWIEEGQCTLADEENMGGGPALMVRAGECLGSAAGALVALLALQTAETLAPAPGSAQSDSTVIRPGPRYEAGAFQQWLLGRGYRHLWTEPVRVEVLDLGRFAGGLEPLEPGGGNQTRTLHMEGEDGRRYIFRSVDKFAGRALPEDLRRTFIHDLFQDHISAMHPTGALAVPALLDAADILHVAPRLVVMPDDPRLGEYREEFAGMLGQIEERPNEGPEGTPGFAGSSRVVGMPRLLERLDEDPAQVAAEREYLTARLVDFLIGDTDRGTDQWRWAGEDRSAGGLFFRPIPRDRDWAFIRSEGPLARLARIVFPKLVSYGPDFPSVEALTYASIHRDRHLLTGLERSTWDSVAQALGEQLTDEVIAEGLSALPPEHQEMEADRLARALKARRDRLPEVAGRFYDHLAREVDVRGTEEADLALVEVRPDGSVEVRLSSPGISTTPYFHREFDPAETREVRLYLLDGEDRAVIRGDAASPIVIRVVGGPDDDVLADSTAGSARVSLYDAEGSNTIVADPDTHVDRAPFEPPETDGGWVARTVARERFRDWGSSRSLGPRLDYGEGAGIILGGRLTRTRYGFRRTPHARQWWVGAAYATGSGGFGVEAGVDRHRENSPVSMLLAGDARQFDAIRFYGFGNDVPAPADEAEHDQALVMQDRVRLTGAVAMDPRPDMAISLGLQGRYVDPRPAPGSPLVDADAFGARAYGTVGVWGEADLDRAAHADGGPIGYAVTARAALHPPVWSAPGWFGTGAAEGRAYLDLGPTLALRVGWKGARGTFPVQEAAFIGGRTTLRGYRHQRFAGDDAVYGSAELRAPLGRVLLLVRGELSAFGFVDAGRVFLDGSSPGGWHRGYGGGLSFSSMGATLSGAYGYGEEHRLYLSIGAPF